MRKIIEPSPMVKAIALQLLLERDRCMRECDDAIALHFVERVKRSSRAQALPAAEALP